MGIKKIRSDSVFKQPARAWVRMLAGDKRPSFRIKHVPHNKRAQGTPGARCARSLACSLENTRVSHRGHTGNTRHSPRNGFNGFLRALPGDRALLLPSPAESSSADLTPSVGVSGPHDFAVRQHARSPIAPSASTASRPASVTIASRPSSETGQRGMYC